MIDLLPRSFFERDPLRCAYDLIGAQLRWDGLSVRVDETEGYTSEQDEASHTFFRPSSRAFVAQYPAGSAYVYLNYGVHWLFNVLCKGGGGVQDGFVLIRAGQPLTGVKLMQRRRGQSELRALCSGPGKLTQALAVTGTHHGLDLCVHPARGFATMRESRGPVLADRRIGISRSTQLPWRFLRAGSVFVSAKPSAYAVPVRGLRSVQP